ncbi:MAG: DUF448 domain-containing protein [Campylobacteraceae bacterium]|nr:DUF448 domain-containing protein [Campylobacteraceae bacterium]
MNGKISPVRMCVVCKSRLSQQILYRFQVKDGVLKPFCKSGRSFYICKVCLDGNQQKLIRTLNNKYNLNLPYASTYGEFLKEILLNG